MNDFSSYEKTIVRELSCRLCLCTDVVKLKPLSAETKRKLKKLFDIVVRADDTLPKAICHECLQQVSAMHLYTVKVDKTQKFLDFYKLKNVDDKTSEHIKMTPIIEDIHPENDKTQVHGQKTPEKENLVEKRKAVPSKEQIEQHGDSEKTPKANTIRKKDLRYHESMPMEEFAKAEKVDKTVLNPTSRALQHKYGVVIPETKVVEKPKPPEYQHEVLDTVVLIDGRPAKQGQALDKQITLFYKMECCICHESGFHFRSLMKHYKDRHGVPGYVTCCDKKFHYFYPKKIIEHMAFHLQPHIFMCPSCHQNFRTSAELVEHQANGGRSEGKITCPRCSERFATYHELGWHILSHRTDKTMQCDYCGKPSTVQTGGGSVKRKAQNDDDSCVEMLPGPSTTTDDNVFNECEFSDLQFWKVSEEDIWKPEFDVAFCEISDAVENQLKKLKHHHRKKTICHMEDVILCSQCIRTLRGIERQEKELKEKVKAKGNDQVLLKHQKFGQAMGLSGDEDASTE